MTSSLSSSVNATLKPRFLRPVRMRVRTLTLIRWVAALGQAITLAWVYFGLGFTFPAVPAVGAVAALALSNLALSLMRTGTPWIGTGYGALFLVFDILQLSLLLFLTGGLYNPFALLFLAPMSIAALVLPPRGVVGLCLLVLSCIGFLDVWHLPLPWIDGALALPSLYGHSIALALVIAVVFVTSYISVVARASRKVAEALAASELALERERRVSALGALAAAIAHELGSPLNTIALISRDLVAELDPEDPLIEDATLLSTQIERCRDILAQLGRAAPADDSAAGDDASPYTKLPLHALVEASAVPHRTDTIPRIDLRFIRQGTTEDEPLVRRSAEILHGLGNLIQNALQFANTQVEVTTTWTVHNIIVTVEDDGPGFSPTVLNLLGEPYMSGREKAGHLGLGIFIARTLLANTGGVLTFEVRGSPLESQGARAVVRWRRDSLDLRRQNGMAWNKETAL